MVRGPFRKSSGGDGQHQIFAEWGAPSIVESPVDLTLFSPKSIFDVSFANFFPKKYMYFE